MPVATGVGAGNVTGKDFQMAFPTFDMILAMRPTAPDTGRAQDPDAFGGAISPELPIAAASLSMGVPAWERM